MVLAILPLALQLTACGPTAEQVKEREAASAAASASGWAGSSAPPLPASPPVSASAGPSAGPSTEGPPADPVKVGVAGNQAGMPVPVQDACQFLLRRDPGRFPAEEAGNCVQAAMVAGTGGTQQLTTALSWIPPGTHTVTFTTAPEFSLVLESAVPGLRITAGQAGSSVDTGSGRINANENGSPEEAYAAVLAKAAELTVNPARVADLLGGTDFLEVDYQSVQNGAARTRITGYRAAAPNADDMMPTGITVWLDDYYRPVRFELTGRSRGIESSITADNVWGP